MFRLQSSLLLDHLGLGQLVLLSVHEVSGEFWARFGRKPLFLRVGVVAELVFSLIHLKILVNSLN